MFEDNILYEIIGSSLVYIDSSNLSSSEKWYYYKLCFVKFGLFKTFKYCTRQLFRIPLRKILPVELYNKIANI